MQVHTEDKPEKRQHHEGRNGDADHRERHRHLVDRGPMMQGGNDPKRYADEQRQRQRDHAEFAGDRKALRDEFGHAEVLVLERRTEIAVRQRREIAAVLNPDGTVQAIGTLEVGNDFGR